MHAPDLANSGTGVTRPVRALQTMRAHLVPQPLIAILTVAMATAGMAAVCFVRPDGLFPPHVRDVLIALYLVGAAVLALQFPIHLRHRTKIVVASVALFLMAVLLPIAVAIPAAALSRVIGDMLTRRQRGLYLSDIATQVGRNALGVLLAALMVQPEVTHYLGDALSLVAAGFMLWACDVLTAPLLFAPVTDESPLHIIRSLVWEGSLAEAAQYGVALLVAMAARQQVIAIIVLPIPTVLVYLAFKRVHEVDSGTRAMLERMADTVDLRDPYTGGHSRRVTEFTTGILKELKVRGPEADLIITAARLHDIGKIGIPDAVLKKPGRLTDEEWEIMKTHPDAGADLLQSYSTFRRGVSIVRHHHERWDGEGYPQRLRGTAIPFGARVIAVADSFDAMTSDRPYRPGMSPTQAATIIEDGRGRQWDADVVDAFLRSIAARLEPAPGARVRRLASSPEAMSTGAAFS